MKWTKEADDAAKQVPFFVRKRFRLRFENETLEAGKRAVSLADVKATQARYLKKMVSEIKGYQIEICFGPSGCPNRPVISDNFLEQIEVLVRNEDLLSFLRKRVEGDLKFHHEFRIALAECPNACSQLQIKDIGIIAACPPHVTEEACNLCEACVDACKENAIALNTTKEFPEIIASQCLHCGKWINVCPTGTLTEGKKGFRVQLGGKLGRHPQLARELPGLYTEQQVIAIVKVGIRYHKQHSQIGERFGHVLMDTDFEILADRYRG